MEKKTILCVDDSSDALRLLMMMLESQGYLTRGFEDAEKALAELQEDEANGRTVDIALLDLMMPRMNGYELLSGIRKIKKYASLPVIMVTAKDKDDEVLDGYHQGADYYITKPFTVDQLKYGLDLYLAKNEL